MPVMHLQDLDIEFRAKRAGDLGGQHGEQIDALTHIAGLDDGGMARGRLDLGLVGGRQAGRADDMDDARLRRQRGEGEGRSGRGEIEHAVDRREHGMRIVADGDAERRQAGHLADVAAESGRALGLDAAGHRAARRLDQHPRQRLAHAPGGSQHGNLHVAHGRRPFTSGGRRAAW